MKNNIDGFEGEKIECSEFTEKVGKDIIDYKFEYKTHLKIIEMQHKELETYKKIAEKLAKELHYTDNFIGSSTPEIILDWARKEVENGR
jgi:hypothetical protein